MIAWQVCHSMYWSSQCLFLCSSSLYSYTIYTSPPSSPCMNCLTAGGRYVSHVGQVQEYQMLWALPHGRSHGPHCTQLLYEGSAEQPIHQQPVYQLSGHRSVVSSSGSLVVPMYVQYSAVHFFHGIERVMWWMRCSVVLVSLRCRSCCCTIPSQCGGSSSEFVCLLPRPHGHFRGIAGQQFGQPDAGHVSIEIHGKGLPVTVSCCFILLNLCLSLSDTVCRHHMTSSGWGLWSQVWRLGKCLLSCHRSGSSHIGHGLTLTSVLVCLRHCVCVQDCRRIPTSEVPKYMGFHLVSCLRSNVPSWTTSSATSSQWMERHCVKWSRSTARALTKSHLCESIVDCVHCLMCYICRLVGGHASSTDQCVCMGMLESGSVHSALLDPPLSVWSCQFSLA